MKQIEIRQAARTVAVADGATILQAALAEGIDYPHGCRSGRCGSCKTRLISGEVKMLEHSRFALSDEEKAQGLTLACCAIPQTDAVVTWLGGDEHLVAHPRRRLHCRVKTLDNATHDIKRVWLDIGEAEPLAFTAGQYARLTFPGAPARDYSMASGPSAQTLEFHIRRVPQGVTTQRIHGLLKPGDRVELEGPFGCACLREQHAGPILCIAGGSGLAPIKAIVDAAIAQGMKQPIHVYFGARSERDLYLLEHFRVLAQRYPNLSFIPVLSDVPVTERWRTGYVTDAIAHDLQDLDGWKVYVAGPPLMVEAVLQLTQARGLRSEDLHADVFFTPAQNDEET